MKQRRICRWSIVAVGTIAAPQRFADKRCEIFNTTRNDRPVLFSTNEEDLAHVVLDASTVVGPDGRRYPVKESLLAQRRFCEEIAAVARARRAA